MDHPACPFCTDDDFVLANELAVARWDANPVTPGHLLIVARRHVAAGQTIAHVHIHLIPRYHGDTPRPRGGVRGVIPDKQSY